MTIPLLTPATPAPSTLDPLTFAPKMDARLVWEGVNVMEMNSAVIPGINDAVASTTAASAAAIGAATAAASSALSAGAVAWVSGQAYAAYASAISSIDFQAYRAMVAVTSTTDPYNDPTRWVAIGKPLRRVFAIAATRAIGTGDLSAMLLCTGTYALTSASAATLGNGFVTRIRNGGTGVITVPATGRNLALAANSECEFWSDGTSLYVTEFSENLTPVITSAATLTVGYADMGSVIKFNGADCALTFADGATLGLGWWIETVNAGTGKIVTAYTSGQTSDGVTTFNMYMKERRRHVWNGASFDTLVMTPYTLVLTSIFSHKQAPGYAFNDIFLVGGGGGGGSGCKYATGLVRLGGGCGGSPVTIRRRVPTPAVNTATTFTPGGAGAGGTSVTANSTPGNNGTVGGPTTYGNITAYGGCLGRGAIYNTFCMATTGSGSLGVGASNALGASSGILGGLPAALPMYIGGSGLSGFGLTVDTISQEGGAPAVSQSNGGNSIYGGASAGTPHAQTTSMFNSGSSQFGVGAGSHGGWITDSDTVPFAAGNAGGTGGWNITGALGGTCGTVPTAGQNGAANAGGLYDVGNSGAGGGSSMSTNAAKGGDGSFPGGAGGGGGSAVNSVGNSGAGGNGAAGYGVIVGVPG